MTTAIHYSVSECCSEKRRLPSGNMLATKNACMFCSINQIRWLVFIQAGCQAVNLSGVRQDVWYPVEFAHLMPGMIYEEFLKNINGLILRFLKSSR